MRWLVLLLLPACLPVPVYRVQRTARVPHPAAPLRTGEPLDGPVELSVGPSTALDVRTPRLADPHASVEVPSVQLRGELRIRFLRDGEIAAIHDHAIDDTIHPIDRTQAPVQNGSIYSMGLAARWSFHSDRLPSFFLGVGTEILQWTIPYVEYRTCVQNCETSPQQQIIRGSDTTMAVGFAVTPTYRIGAFALFGGLYAAPHPTIERKGTELSATDYDSDLSEGRFNFILHAGVEYRLGPVSLLAQIQDDVTRAPVSYGPSFGFALALHIPDAYIAPEPHDRRD